MDRYRARTRLRQRVPTFNVVGKGIRAAVELEGLLVMTGLLNKVIV